MRLRVGVVALLAVIVLTGPAWGQPYPTRPIKIVVPFGPGSGSDTGTRILSERLSAALGQTVVVENRPGANGVIAAQNVKSAAPDGYTFLIGTNSTHGANSGLMKTLSYDPLKDFEPITLIGVFSSVLVVHPSVLAKTVGELVALGKSGTPLTFATGNTSSLIMGEMLKQRAGFNATRVPFPSNPPALTEVVAGRISLMFPDLSTGLAQVKSGAVRPLAVVSMGERNPALPDVPTMAEAGIADFNFVGWIGLFAPAGTPAAIVERVARETSTILTTAEVKQRMEQLGADAKAMDPAAFKAFVNEEVVRMPRILKNIGIEPQ